MLFCKTSCCIFNIKTTWSLPQKISYDRKITSNTWLFVLDVLHLGCVTFSSPKESTRMLSTSAALLRTFPRSFLFFPSPNVPTLPLSTSKLWLMACLLSSFLFSSPHLSTALGLFDLLRRPWSTPCSILRMWSKPAWPFRPLSLGSSQRSFLCSRF